MQGASGKKAQYGFVDIMKFLLALLIVSSHYISENAVGRISSVIDYASSLYVIVVPFFFACSGFFLFRKLDGGENDGPKIKSYCIRLLVMYAGWSVLYYLFKVLTWIRFGTTTEEVLRDLLHAVTYSTYKTIWFLPATVVGVLMTVFLTRKIGIRGTIAAAAVLYLIGCIGVSYSFLLKDSKLLSTYNSIFESTRNGLFNGFPFVLIGYLAAKKEKEGFSGTLKKNVILTAVFGAAFIAEALLIKKKGAPNVNTLIFLLPFTYSFLQLCLGVKKETGSGTLWLRKMSTDVFLCQRLFLSALPALFPESFFGKLLTGNPYLGWFAVTALSLATAAVLVEIAKRSKWFSRFC